MFCKPKLAQLGLSLNFNFSIGLPSSLQTICKLEECGTFFKFNLQTLSYSYFRGCIRRMRLNLGCWGLSVAFPSPPRSKHLVLLLLLGSRPRPCSVSGERFRWTFLEIAASVDFPWMRRPKYWKWLNKSQLIFSLLHRWCLVTSCFTLAAEEAEEQLKEVGGGERAVMRLRRDQVNTGE